MPTNTHELLLKAINRMCEECNRMRMRIKRLTLANEAAQRASEGFLQDAQWYLSWSNEEKLKSDVELSDEEDMMSDEMFVFEVHHGGYFVNMPAKKFSMGKVEFIRNVDKDLMSYSEMISMIKDLGCTENCNIYHKLLDYNCDLDAGLRELKTDAEVWDMFAIHIDRETISIYVENAKLNGDDVVNLDSRETFVGGSEPFSFNIGSGSGEGPSNLLPPDIQDMEDDDLNTPMNSDEEGKVEFSKFLEDRDMERLDLKKGMMFANATVFKAALRKHALQNGTEFVFLKNEGDRVSALRRAAKRDHMVEVSDSQTYRAKNRASETIERVIIGDNIGGYVTIAK
ncbi:hypothetical protein RHSIM_Rhsim08G0180300 [Rhododendron simsii]|uniref:PB1-like domain-containing protein n=1 Tax=Rhododendron simsii TaxID=118357 RepID=A0A834LJM7_RHOSS|nr:hypothetical protein RHSIM_Rhsim08G0180300 [Rhododendron simsii]